MLVPSKMAYIMSIADVFTKPLGKNFKILIDDEELIEREFMLAALANAHYYGGGFHVAPNAYLNDGYMDLCLVDRVTRKQFIGIIGKYKSGQHVDENGNSSYPFMHYRRCKKVVIEAPTSMGICGDGEITPAKSITVEIMPKAIAFSAPKGSVCTALVKEEASEASAEMPQGHLFVLLLPFGGVYRIPHDRGGAGILRRDRVRRSVPGS
jgi:diacylglycerol kinase (ATP)